MPGIRGNDPSVFLKYCITITANYNKGKHNSK